MAGQIKLKLARLFRCALTLISPRLNGIVVFYFKFRRLPDLKDPKEFNEKLLKLKLDDYDKNPLVKICADKYAVRDYIRSKGLSHILNEIIEVHDKVEDIDFERLPDKFAMKWNFGSGMNVICQNKDQLDPKAILKQMKRWGKSKSYLGYAEMQYKGVPKKIIIEKYVENGEKSLPSDYKIYCFNGKAKAILHISDREMTDKKAAFFTTDWRCVGTPNDKYVRYDTLPDPPESLAVMLDAAEKLSEGFPFVRVDFYECNGKAVFGEMTFTPAGCHDVSNMPIDGISMSDMLCVQ